MAVLAKETGPRPTFYAIIDAADAADPASLEQFSKLVKNALSSSNERMELRVLFTARTETFAKVESYWDGDIHIPEIKLNPADWESMPHREDLLKFAEDKVRRMKNFSGKLAGERADLRERARQHSLSRSCRAATGSLN
jgi:hypothetical protein